ncbi:MAG: heme exporter protein CcmB [Deltaproteobacteria bacterium]|nr:heme exporter protein CcmB [Deltaproteobacteria bacterium]
MNPSLVLRLTWLLLKKDLRVAARSRETWVLVLLFAILCVLVFAFGFLREGGDGAEVVPGALWVTLQFSATVALMRLFSAEEEAGALTTVSRSVAGSAPLFFSKALMQLIFTGGVTLTVLPLVLVFFGATAMPIGPTLAALLLGLLGQAVVGTLVAGLMLRVRQRDVLLPLVLYPILAPTLIAGVKVTAISASGGDPEVIATWLRLMVVFDAVFVLACPWLYARASGP